MRTYSADELRTVSDQTDHARVAGLSDADRNVIDPETGEINWIAAIRGFPSSKEQLTLRIDSDVVQWFKAGGKGYQTRMNAVLRSYMNAHDRPQDGKA